MVKDRSTIVKDGRNRSGLTYRGVHSSKALLASLQTSPQPSNSLVVGPLRTGPPVGLRVFSIVKHFHNLQTV